MREVVLDGSVAAVGELVKALGDALDGVNPVLPLPGGDPKIDALRTAMAPDEPVEPDTAVIIATSGSTGDPKGVLLSPSALIASAEATHTRLGGPGRWLLATPACYIGGIQVLVRGLLAGAVPEVLDLRTGFDPDGFAVSANTVLNQPGRHYTALVPTQFTRLIDHGGAGLEAAAGFDAIVLGGSPLSPAARAAAEDAGVRVVSAYGMSETASGCVYDGVPLDGVHIRLSTQDSDIGVIEISGPMLANGYRLAPELTAESFVDGWFRTGDLGRLTGDRLEVIGRADDMINTGGVKVAPVLIERALTGDPAVRHACVVGVPDPQWGQAVVAAIVPADGKTPDEAALADAVRAAVGRAAVPKRFALLPAFPMRGPGKVDRAAVVDAITD